jgi:hypothetical protein
LGDLLALVRFATLRSRSAREGLEIRSRHIVANLDFELFHVLAYVRDLDLQNCDIGLDGNECAERGADKRSASNGITDEFAA